MSILFLTFFKSRLYICILAEQMSLIFYILISNNNGKDIQFFNLNTFLCVKTII